MPRHAKPMQVELLSGEEGHMLLVRGTDLAECLSIAAEEAAANDMRVADPEGVHLEWLRKVPCPGREHEIDGGACWATRPGYHVIYSRRGPGAFRGIMAEVVHDA